VKAEGIFRVSGSDTKVKEMKNTLDNGGSLDFSDLSEQDCHAVAGICYLLQDIILNRYSNI
jgi:hypothetical protein